MRPKSLKLAVVSDIHLGSRRTPTIHILENLYSAFENIATNSDIDLLCITGDLFDRYLSLVEDDVYEIHAWMTYLVNTCKKRDIVLRLLEGTPSHDWKQGRLLETIKKSICSDIDIKWVSQLSIEHMDKFGIDVLYLPDEWSADNNDTWVQIEKLLKTHGLSQVDFVFMHGQFPFQLPPHLNVPVHDPDKFESITRYFIFCGHVHKPQRLGKIIIPGSFDRLAHGEEEPKGHWRVLVTKNSNHVEFIENTNAYKYITIDISNMDIKEAIEYVNKKLDTLHPGAYVRLTSTSKEPIGPIVETLRANNKIFHFSSKQENKDKLTEKSLEDLRSKYTIVPITPTTVVDLIKAKLKEEDINDYDINKAIDLLYEVI